MRRRIYEIIEVADENDDISHVYDIIMIFDIIMSIIPLGMKDVSELWADIEDLCVTVFILSLACLAGFARNVSSFSQHFQCAVRSKVKNVTVGLLLAVDLARRLHTEDSLHISCCSSGIGTGKHKYCSPFFHSNAGGQLSTRQRD